MSTPNWAGHAYGGEDAPGSSARPVAATSSQSTSPLEKLVPEHSAHVRESETTDSAVPAQSPAGVEVPPPPAQPPATEPAAAPASVEALTESDEGTGQVQAPSGKRSRRREAPAPVFTGTVEDLLQPARPQEKPLAETGWRYGLRRATFGLLKLRASQDETQDRSDVAVINSEWASLVSVTVANPKGGVGKTPLSLMLAATFGAARGGGVLFIDGNESMGTAGLRSERGRFDTTITELLEELPRFEEGVAHRGEWGQFVRTQTHGHFDVLASDEEPAHMGLVGEDEISRIHQVASRYYQIICTDTGNNTRASGWGAILSRTDQLVIPLQLGLGDTVDAGRMIDQLKAQGREDLVRGAIGVIGGRVDADPKDARLRRQWLESQVRTIVQIPHDPALMADELRLPHLAPATRRAFRRLAAEVAAGFNEADASRTPVRRRRPRHI